MPPSPGSRWTWRHGWWRSAEDVDRTVDADRPRIPVTYIGHSYGGSILGTAEALGPDRDRTLYLAAAGAGVGVDEPATGTTATRTCCGSR